MQGLQKFKTESNYVEVVEKLFSLFPDKEHYSDAGPDRCRICAVVGNSGNLKGSYYGRLIDFHDFVIRYEYVEKLRYVTVINISVLTYYMFFAFIVKLG